MNTNLANIHRIQDAIDKLTKVHAELTSKIEGNNTDLDERIYVAWTAFYNDPYDHGILNDLKDLLKDNYWAKTNGALHV